MNELNKSKLSNIFSISLEINYIVNQRQIKRNIATIL